MSAPSVDRRDGGRSEDWQRFVRECVGLDVGDRWDMTVPAIRRAARRAGVSSTEEYRRLLRADRAAFDAFVDELTIGETYFFRDPAQLEFLQRSVLPDLVASREPRPVSVWSVGCATGEEPYTIAIMSCESRLAARIRVLGSDVSRARLASASKGTYGRWSLRAIPQPLLRRYFSTAGGHSQLDAAVRRQVRFSYLNLARPIRPQAPVFPVDIILCRNVLIYFGRDGVERIATELAECLAEGGWLILGPSDPHPDNVPGCERVSMGAGHAFRRFARSTAPGDELSTGVRHLSLVRYGHAGDPPRRETPPIEASLTGRALLAMAQACLDMKDYPRAADLAQRYVDEGNSDPGGALLLARALGHLGRSAAAARACTLALADHPDHAELLTCLAVHLTRCGQYEAAVAPARRAVYLDRRLAMPHVALGMALARLGHVHRARSALMTALRLLTAMDDDAPVTAADGDSPARIAATVRAHLALLMERK